MMQKRVKEKYKKQLERSTQVRNYSLAGWLCSTTRSFFPELIYSVYILGMNSFDANNDYNTTINMALESRSPPPELFRIRWA